MPAHLIAEDGPFRGLVLNLEEGNEWIIGRDPDASDFYLEDSTVSRKHAKLHRTEEGITLKNLSRVNPTLVNGEEHKRAVILREGDRVRIGGSTFLFSEEEVPDLAMPPPKKPKKKSPGYDDIFGDLDDFEPQKTSEVKEEEESEEIAKEPVSAGEDEMELPPEPPKPEPTVYDTIFEDTGSGEEIPFHLSQEAPLLLKVIAGPNAGAEIGLEKGKSYTIGKDANTCDIVFQDLSVSRNHARLTISEDGKIEIEDLGSKNGVAVNGILLTEPKEISSQDMVSVGTTIFMVIDREAPQETIYSPLASSFEAPSADEEGMVEEAVVEKRNWKKEPIPTKYLVIAGSIAASFLIVFLSFFSLFKSHDVEIAGKEPVSKIKEALAKFSDVQFSYNPGSGKLFLVGHVLTGVDYQEMLYRVGQIDFITSVEDNVVIDEGVWKMMNDVISTNPNWRTVSVHAPQAGKFVAVGYVPDAQEAAKLSEYLTVNFPYLDLLENRVVIEENLNAQLQSLLIKRDLGAVSFQVTNGNVVLTGRYSEERKKQYNAFLKEINELRGVASVKNFAIPVDASMAGIDITDQYQVSGASLFDGRGFSVVVNGRMYTLGDLVDGMKITNIEQSMILLEKDGLKYRIDYTL
jgi:type III secretion system YscD/HrpQ family protein